MIAWLDCRVGVAGDMLLGALVDAGADERAVKAAVAAVSDGAAEVTFDRVLRCGFAALKATVTTPGERPVSHRGLAEIVGMIEHAGLPDEVGAASVAVFTLIGEVEARQHGCDVADVHFHEVGALDTIADVVGVVTAWHSLGWPEATGSMIGLGTGMVRAGHGPMSVPAPAVAGVLARTGAPTWAGPLPMEATTPTGSALVAQLAGAWGDPPAMIVRSQGFGAGSADPAGVANVTRVVLGEPVRPAAGEPADVVELRCNVDDLDPRVWPSVLAALLAAGALDAWLAPITMKHGRPAQLLTVLGHHETAADLRRLIFELTPTFGVRWQTWHREILDREWQQVLVRGHPVAVKIGRRDGRQVTIQPEWRDVESAAAALDVPARVVLAEAQRGVRRLT
ncbi:MAG: Pyridinium-3,5-bisthiocarboxylic acid mononucleotide nickel insertion protein [Actinomycetota bacterium]|nr:Pyridinium-3,5-bisthiocarboxylic acid mononucleotide nickel insertion protein [Actinomycetota bacterium]